MKRTKYKLDTAFTAGQGYLETSERDAQETIRTFALADGLTADAQDNVAAVTFAHCHCDWPQSIEECGRLVGGVGSEDERIENGFRDAILRLRLEVELALQSQRAVDDSLEVRLLLEPEQVVDVEVAQDVFDELGDAENFFHRAMKELPFELLDALVGSLVRGADLRFEVVEAADQHVLVVADLDEQGTDVVHGCE